MVDGGVRTSKKCCRYGSSRLFDGILQDEVAELQELAASIEARSADRHELRHSKELQLVNTRIKEVRLLLEALRERFGAMWLGDLDFHVTSI